MYLLNKKTKTIISTDIKIAESLEDQLFGLIKKSNPRSLVFNTRFGLHTLGLKTPIDVLVLDQNYKVVQVKNSLNPNSFYFWNPKYFTVIELPNKTLSKTRIKLGDILQLVEGEYINK